MGARPRDRGARRDRVRRQARVGDHPGGRLVRPARGDRGFGPLPVDAASRRGCGRCSACLPACPTGAIVAPGVIDARRCISYLTIEHRGPIPHALRASMGTWAFGCDLCQEACPINDRLAPEPLDNDAATTAHGPVPYPDLVECLELSEAGFAARFGGPRSAHGTCRSGAELRDRPWERRGSAALPALRRSAELDPDDVVREAARWGIAQLTSGRAHRCGQRKSRTAARAPITNGPPTQAARSETESGSRGHQAGGSARLIGTRAPRSRVLPSKGRTPRRTPARSAAPPRRAARRLRWHRRRAARRNDKVTMPRPAPQDAARKVVGSEVRGRLGSRMAFVRSAALEPL